MLCGAIVSVLRTVAVYGSVSLPVAVFNALHCVKMEYHLIRRERAI